jgi:hypothetical protein
MTLWVQKDRNLFSLGVGLDWFVQSYVAIIISELETLKWHFLLGHFNSRYLSKMKTHEFITRLPPFQSTLPLCVDCTFRKQHRLLYSIDPSTQATKSLTLIHTNICGPMSIPSLGGALYFLIFIDNFSRCTYLPFTKEVWCFHLFHSI